MSGFSRISPNLELETMASVFVKISFLIESKHFFFIILAMIIVE